MLINYLTPVSVKGKTGGLKKQVHHSELEGLYLPCNEDSEGMLLVIVNQFIKGKQANVFRKSTVCPQ